MTFRIVPCPATTSDGAKCLGPEGHTCDHEFAPPNPTDAEIARLKGELEEAHRFADEAQQLQWSAEAERDALTARLAEVEAAYGVAEIVIGDAWKALGIEVQTRIPLLSLAEHIARLRTALAEAEQARERAIDVSVAACNDLSTARAEREEAQAKLEEAQAELRDEQKLVTEMARNNATLRADQARLRAALERIIASQDGLRVVEGERGLVVAGLKEMGNAVYAARDALATPAAPTKK